MLTWVKDYDFKVTSVDLALNIERYGELVGKVLQWLAHTTNQLRQVRWSKDVFLTYEIATMIDFTFYNNSNMKYL